jgi:CRISPR-associated protein Cmr1
LNELVHGRIQNISLKVVTPLFLGNASQQAELRPPSLKGVMRFWHRAMGPENLTTEGEMFGSSGKSESGQAPFFLRVGKNIVRNETVGHRSTERRYLGYGVEKRQCIPPGETLELNIVFRPCASLRVREGVRQSLRFLNYFGGLGARSRRGFGSVVLADDLPADFDDLTVRLQRELQGLSLVEEGHYTMFSLGSRVVVLPAGDTWEEALDLIGGLMLEVRNPQKSPPGYPWAKQDAGLMANFLKTGQANRAPARAAFGLPHDYPQIGIKVVVEKARPALRRASPLFIHVHQMRDGQHAVVVTFLPASLLPNNRQIVISRGGRSARVAPPDHWGAIEGFLDHIAAEPGAKEVLI